MSIEISLYLTTLAIFGLVTLMITSTVFLIATIIKDNSIMDIAYGPTFLLATVATILAIDQVDFMSVVATVLIGTWSARLGIRILLKNSGKPEDARYAAWRKQWTAKSPLYFIVRSYAQIYVLQGIIITLIASPVILIIANPQYFNPLFLFAGILIWFTGLTIETLADWQLDAFLKKKKKGEPTTAFLKDGLFKYSRRPNYFGETLIWWGFFILALTVPYGYVALISPLLITFIVTRVTGPMLETIFEEKFGDEYKQYQETTSYFIPFLPKR